MADGVFEAVFTKIGADLKKLATLEVTTYRGTITIAGGALPADFEAAITSASAATDFKLVACTRSRIDGDVSLFLDRTATEGELATHNLLVENAMAKRLAVLKLFGSAIANIT